MSQQFTSLEEAIGAMGLNVGANPDGVIGPRVRSQPVKINKSAARTGRSQSKRPNVSAQPRRQLVIPPEPQDEAPDYDEPLFDGMTLDQIDQRPTYDPSILPEVTAKVHIELELPLSALRSLFNAQ